MHTTDQTSSGNRHRERRTGRGVRRAAAMAGVIGVAVTGLAALGPTGSAHAQPPANDSIRNATPITTIPATFTQDTSEATSSRSDGACVGGRSIWYRYRPTADSTERLTTVGSDYDTLLTVFTGPRRDRELLRCSDDDLFLQEAVQIRFRAGTTYWIAVSSCCRPSSLRSGTSQLHVYHPAPAGGDVSAVDAVTGGISGSLIVSGTADCDTPSILFLRVVARQRVGDNVARGAARPRPLACLPGEETEWSLRIDSRTSWAFQPGSQVLISGEWDIWDGFDVSSGEFEVALTPTNDPDAREQRS